MENFCLIKMEELLFIDTIGKGRQERTESEEKEEEEEGLSAVVFPFQKGEWSVTEELCQEGWPPRVLINRSLG